MLYIVVNFVFMQYIVVFKKSNFNKGSDSSMIQKIYEENVLIKYAMLTKDIDTIKNNTEYNVPKKTGSLAINIENRALCLIWDNENSIWLDYDMKNKITSSDNTAGTTFASTDEVIKTVQQVLN